MERTIFSTPRRTKYPIQIGSYSTRKFPKWKPEIMIRLVYQLSLLGKTDEQMAEVMGININTLNLWKRTYPEFLASMKEGKDKADGEVVESLHKRATGFWQNEIEYKLYKNKIIEIPVKKYYPPDSWAANKWLSLRCRGEWSETIKIDHTNTNININKLDLNGVTDEQLRLITQIGLNNQRPKEIGDGRD